MLDRSARLLLGLIKQNGNEICADCGMSGKWYIPEKLWWQQASLSERERERAVSVSVVQILMLTMFVKYYPRGRLHVRLCVHALINVIYF